MGSCSRKSKMSHEVDRQIGARSLVMLASHRMVMVNSELSQRAKLSIYFICIPASTRGHETQGRTERHSGYNSSVGCYL